MGIRLTVRNARLAFETLYTPERFPGGTDPTPYFSASFILPPDHPQLSEIREAMLAAAMEKWPKKGAEMLKAAEMIGKVPLRSGDTKPNSEGFSGNWFVSARSKKRPTLKDRDGRTPLVESDGKLYGGCYVNALLEFFGYDTGSNGVGADLRGVQLVRDGDAFGGGRPASDEEFADLSVGAEEELA